MKNIKFTTHESVHGIIPEPKPAKKCIPQWYKNLSKEIVPLHPDPNIGVSQLLSIKACPPIQDYICTGYILSTISDWLFTKTDSEGDEAPEYGVSDKLSTLYQSFSYHSPMQVKNTSFEGKTTYKFNAPWSIETPKGYSCLFVRPFFSDTKGVEIIPAVVDTDVYHQVNFPFFLNREEESFTLPKDTPIVQIIPFKREAWKMSNEMEKEADFGKKVAINLTVFRNLYRKLRVQNKRTFL